MTNLVLAGLMDKLCRKEMPGHSRKYSTCTCTCTMDIHSITYCIRYIVAD